MVFLSTALAVALQAQQPQVVPGGSASNATALGTAQAVTNGPQIQFDNQIYDFGRVTAGDVVKHTFIFTNTGNQTLELSDVHPSCGCTTAGDWTRKVEPGQTGSIPLQVNTANFNGAVTKTVTVTCNAKPQSSLVLQIKGTIFWPIEISPSFVVLYIPPDSPKATNVVRIINHLDQPLTLSQPESTNAAFTASLKTKTEGKEFELTISSVAPFGAGGIQAFIHMKTSLTNRPVLAVPFVASLVPVVSAMPPVVMLPGGPLSAKTPVTVSFQNNSTNHLTLSDPQLEIPGAEVDFKEGQPGRYTASLTFPQGYEITPGQSPRFKVKCSDARLPILEVPIMQQPRPPAPPPTAAPASAATTPKA